MASCKPTNLTTSDYTFYSNSNADFPFIVVCNGRAWGFSFNDAWSYVSRQCNTGWLFVLTHQPACTPLPTFTSDYPEFFI